MVERYFFFLLALERSHRDFVWHGECTGWKKEASAREKERERPALLSRGTRQRQRRVCRSQMHFLLHMLVNPPGLLRQLIWRCHSSGPVLGAFIVLVYSYRIRSPLENRLAAFHSRLQLKAASLINIWLEWSPTAWANSCRATLRRRNSAAFHQEESGWVPKILWPHREPRENLISVSSILLDQL